MASFGIAAQNAIQEPNDKTIDYQDDDRGQAWPMPNVANLERNQCACGEDHQKFGPSFLKINAESFREQNGRIKGREQRRCTKLATGEGVLQFVEQIQDGTAVMQEQFF